MIIDSKSIFYFVLFSISHEEKECCLEECSWKSQNKNFKESHCREFVWFWKCWQFEGVDWFGCSCSVSFTCCCIRFKRETISRMNSTCWSDVLTMRGFIFFYPSRSCLCRYNISAPLCLLLSSVIQGWWFSFQQRLWPCWASCCLDTRYTRMFLGWIDAPELLRSFAAFLFPPSPDLRFFPSFICSANTKNGRFFFQVHAQIPSGSLFPQSFESYSWRESRRGEKKSLTAEFCSVLRAATLQESVASQ